ncbi:hypothetical protein HDV02_004250 [Globomyces sp. JEL0801]|nr:hypothetical protein HDV02_004250 [Globomyces sp. JEL0801]
MFYHPKIKMQKAIAMAVPVVIAFHYIWSILAVGDVTILHEDTTVHDICLVAPWNGQYLTDYHKLMFFTANNTKAGKMIFVHEGVALSSFKEFTNVQFLNVHSISKFVAYHMCRYYSYKPYSASCIALTKALDYSDRHVWASSLAQYRYAMQEWIGPSRCKSWAFVDHDIIFGDIEGYIRDNQYYWDSDVVGFATHSTSRTLFTPGQFTAHIQTKRPEYVNSLFSQCAMYSSGEAMIRTLSGGDNFYALDEGCYGTSIMKGPQVYTHFVYQDSIYSDKEFFIWINGRLLSFSNDEVFDYQNKTRVYFDIKPTIPPQLESIIPISIHLNASDTIYDCAHWIPHQYNLCFDPNNWDDLQTVYSNYSLTYGPMRIENSQMEIVGGYEHPEAFKEHAFLHLHSLKDRLDYRHFDSSKENFILVKESGQIISFDNGLVGLTEKMNWILSTII